MAHLIGSAHNAQLILVAIIVIFVVIPIAYQLVLKLFEPSPDDVPGRHWWQRKGEETHEWGAQDAAHLRHMKYGSAPPHQRGRGSFRR